MITILKMALLFSMGLDFVVIFAVGDLWLKFFALISLVLVILSLREEMKGRWA